MKKLIFLNQVRCLATTLDLLLIKLISTAPGYRLSIMAYLHVMFCVTLTDLQNPTVGWYQSVVRYRNNPLTLNLSNFFLLMKLRVVLTISFKHSATSIPLKTLRLLEGIGDTFILDILKMFRTHVPHLGGKVHDIQNQNYDLIIITG